MVRNRHDPLTPKANDLHHQQVDGRFGIGSGHPGVMNVLIGDGSVRVFPLTIDTELNARLAHVSDGVAVSPP